MKIRTERYPGAARPIRDRGATTVGDYLSAWLDARQTLRPSTRLAYEIHLRRYLIPHLGHLQLANLSLGDIEAMYTAIAAQDRAISPATMHRIHATLVNALGNAVRRGLIASNPAQLVELPRTPYSRLQVWSASQLAEFLSATAADRLQPLFLLLGLTGLRRGEAIGLRWSDIDLDRGQLHVEQQLSTIARRTQAGPPKSVHGRRTLPISARLHEALDCHAGGQRLERWAAGADWVDTDLVFTTTDGQALNPGRVSRHFDRLVAATSLPPIRLHDLRHTSASLGLASGESLLEVSRRLGHSSITITADIYSHISPATARHSAERLTDLLTPTTKEGHS